MAASGTTEAVARGTKAADARVTGVTETAGVETGITEGDQERGEMGIM